MNALGLYLIVSLGFVVTALLEFALVIFIHRRMLLNKSGDNKVTTGKNEKRNKSRNTKIIGPMKSKMIPSISASIKSIETNRDIKALPLISHIDLIAFGLHFLSFLIFNIVYWTDRV